MKLTIRTPEDRERFLKVVNAAKLDGREYVAEFKKKVRRRSVPQLKLYWVWMKAIEEQSGSGYTSEEIHEFNKSRFLAKKNILGVSLAASTSILDTKQMSEYLEKVQHFWGTEFACELLFPEDTNFIEFYDKYYQ